MSASISQSSPTASLDEKYDKYETSKDDNISLTLKKKNSEKHLIHYNMVVSKIEGEDLPLDELRAFVKYLEDNGDKPLLMCLYLLHKLNGVTTDKEANKLSEKYPSYIPNPSDLSTANLQSTVSNLNSKLQMHLHQFLHNNSTQSTPSLRKRVSIYQLNSKFSFENAICNDLILNNFQNFLQKEERDLLLSFYLAVRRFKNPQDDTKSRSKWKNGSLASENSDSDTSELSLSTKESKKLDKPRKNISLSQAENKIFQKRNKGPLIEDITAIDKKYLGILEGARGSFLYEPDLRREFKQRVESGTLEWTIFDKMVDIVKEDLEVLYFEFFTSQVKGDKIRKGVERSKTDSDSVVHKRKLNNRRKKE